MSRYARLATTSVPQSEPLNARQVQNNASGYVFQVDDWARLDRFLTLGSDAPTYYQKAPDLTRENAKCVERCYAADPVRAAARIAEISDAGRAPKNDPAIYALAIGASHKDVKVRQAALAQVGKVCRTATHLFMFMDLCRTLGRGWGRSLKRAVARWYENRSPAALAFQAIKYRNRENYTHKRALQLAHPKSGPIAQTAALYNWICEKDYAVEDLPDIVRAHLDAMKSTNEAEWVYLAKEYRLPWEALPTAALKSAKVWSAMLPEMGLTALIRNLGAMTEYGTLAPLGTDTRFVVDRLADGAELQRARIHPFTILQALAVYRSGQGFRGSRSWTPIPAIVDALDGAFYLAFKNVVPTGKRTLIALDVSGSMGSAMIDSPLSVREAGAALALVTARTESQHHIVGFSAGLPGAWVSSRSSRHGWAIWASQCRDGDGISPLMIGPRTRLDDAVRMVTNIPFGATDCALPMLYASATGIDVDVFVTITDNETFAGGVHPMEALRQYRQKSGIAAKMIVVGMTATSFSIADSEDGGCLDVVGWDSSAPSVMADFARS